MENNIIGLLKLLTIVFGALTALFIVFKNLINFSEHFRYKRMADIGRGLIHYYIAKCVKKELTCKNINSKWIPVFTGMTMARSWFKTPCSTPSSASK